MPGILPMKVIRVGSSAPARIAQACDRCRSKKIRCDGLRPTCSQCANVGFECKTSDKLSRRAFPRGYTESLEERVRALETETRELKDLLDSKDEKIDVLSKIQRGTSSRRASNESAKTAPAIEATDAPLLPATLHVEQPRRLYPGPGHDPLFVGNSSTRSVADSLVQKIEFSGRQCHQIKPEGLLRFQTSPHCSMSLSNEAFKPPPRLVTDQMVNVFFQEWAPLFPVLHRPTFLTIYESYVTNPQRVPSRAAQVQLNLVFGIAALSNKRRIAYDTSATDAHWLNVLDTFVKQTTFANLQCFVLAQLYCIQTGDYSRLNYYKTQSVAMALSLGLHQSQASFSLTTLVCESRKKVFWSLYSLDRFTAAILGQPMIINDSTIHCEYPVNVDDEYISDQGIQPALPGELTKLSSALEFFKIARVLSSVLVKLYPATASYQLGLDEVNDLSKELDEWLSGLPGHLKMEFVNDKPAAQAVNSRSPILLLAYHFIRTLILRPAACSLDSEHSCASTLALATSTKMTIQLLKLLEERNLSYSFCVNRFDLVTLCGCSLLLEILDLEQDSLLMKDFQRDICAVVDMLQRHGAPAQMEFKQLACMFLSVRRDSAIEHPPHIQGPSPEQSPADTPSSQSDFPDPRNVRSCSPGIKRSLSRRTSVVATATSASRAGAARKFRPIAPCTQRQASSDPSVRASTKTPSLSDISSVTSARSPGISSQRSVNLDYFAFPPNAKPQSEGVLSGSPGAASPGWDKLFESVREGLEDGHQEESDWPSFTDFLSPLLEPATAASPEEFLGRNQRFEMGCSATNACRGSPGKFAGAVNGAKSHSIVSFSGESMDSREELGHYEFVGADQDVTLAAAAAMADGFIDEDSSAMCRDAAVET